MANTGRDVGLAREQALASESAGDFVTAIRYWNLTIASAERGSTEDAAASELDWLRQRLRLAQSALRRDAVRRDKGLH